MPTTFHRARRLLAAGAIAGVAVFGVAACENTGEGGPVDTEETSEEPMEDGTEESGGMTDDMSEDDSMSEEPMEDDMSEEDPMDGEMSEEPMDDEG
ncbi:hypothetical protein ACOQFV_04480 [Nocardiopsis changdeensis]|uniref:DNA primase n=1 Tax=Nocardiopsis changdeensis TaxID=2831969 RepID=A0ABX8BR24_9ACTN|nr:MULTISPECIES: hypothetical protein [Nocardiopsis]QUX22853.1 hypothetical protein KGD84_32055 [Nocardiopsis changdeensis]QYX38795.1 hypothetical protein K1J57_09435 [Nocardiopsis sp. MT53]